MSDIQVVRGQIWRETRNPNYGRISKVLLVLGEAVFLQRCREDGVLVDLTLVKKSSSALAAEDGWELLQF